LVPLNTFTAFVMYSRQDQRDGCYASSNTFALSDCTVAEMGVTVLPRWYEASATGFDAAVWLLHWPHDTLPFKVIIFVDFIACVVCSRYNIILDRVR